MIKQRFQTKWRFVSAKDLTSAIACWAVKQSPYECPHNLVSAIRALNKRAVELLSVKKTYARWNFTKLTEKQIKKVVEILVLGTPEVQVWNRCRKGKTPAFIASSIYWNKPNPDRDFIDLHALVLNVMRDFRKAWADEDREKEETNERKTQDRNIPAPAVCRATDIHHRRTRSPA
ncbi:MAG: hypothetical protein ACOYB3_00315 [Azonexus sp.]